MDSSKRLYIFTGKGGVGKTTCAFSFAYWLKKQKKKVVYAYIANGSIETKSSTDAEIIVPGLDLLPLNLTLSTKEYVKMKLKSELVASLVIKAPFFKSLVSMIPGFNYLIYLGKIMKLIEDDPELHIVFDSPSSGHALTMLKATSNFSEIFKTGALYEDTLKMKSFLFKQNIIKINIISLATELAQTEAIELRKEIENIDNNIEADVFYNNIMPANFLNSQEIPQSLKDKINNEQSLIAAVEKRQQIPHSNALNSHQIIEEISPFMENFV